MTYLWHHRPFVIKTNVQPKTELGGKALDALSVTGICFHGESGTNFKDWGNFPDLLSINSYRAEYG